MKKDYGKLSVSLHKKIVGKIAIASKTEIRNLDDLSTVYSPGVAEPCRQIVRDPKKVYQMTMKASCLSQLSPMVLFKKHRYYPRDYLQLSIYPLFWRYQPKYFCPAIDEQIAICSSCFLRYI